MAAKKEGGQIQANLAVSEAGWHLKPTVPFPVLTAISLLCTLDGSWGYSVYAKVAGRVGEQLSAHLPFHDPSQLHIKHGKNCCWEIANK